MLRKIVKKVIEPAAIGIICAGIAALCQPWILELHRKGFLITGVGLAIFIVVSHVKPPVQEEKPEEV
jgi:hypothetical protein